MKDVKDVKEEACTKRFIATKRKHRILYHCRARPLLLLLFNLGTGHKVKGGGGVGYEK